MKPLQELLVERFMRYTAIPSQSDARQTQIPSTQGQLELAKLLQEELKALGIKDLHLDQHGILLAHIPGNTTAPTIGFLAHLDTVDVSLSPVIKPQRHTFEGKDLCINPDIDFWIRPSEHPEIQPYIGEEILFSDGTSVLGADDKAAVSIFMQLLHDLVKDASILHGDIYIAFVPDEEIGLRGAKVMDLTRFPVDFAYTIDCCGCGELVYETFNAAQARVTITGVTAHPMSAKGVLINPILLAKEFMEYFDPLQTPECTEGREGYQWIHDIQGNQHQAILEISIRDFDLENFKRRKAYILDVIKDLQTKHPKASFECSIEDVYSNIANTISENRKPIDILYQAYEELGIKPITLAMRGGTDGSELSARGICTPNYFTGAHNFHSKYEFLPLSSFEKSYWVTRKILEISCRKN